MMNRMLVSSSRFFSDADGSIGRWAAQGASFRIESAACAGPGLFFEVGTDGSGEQKPTGSAMGVHCPLDCSQHGGDRLPFIEE